MNELRAIAIVAILDRWAEAAGGWRFWRVPWRSWRRDRRSARQAGGPAGPRRRQPPPQM